MSSSIKRNKYQSGMTALAAVVIIGATVLVMSKGALLLGMGELEISLASVKGGEAASLANGCLDEELASLKRSGFTSRTRNFELFKGSCLTETTGTENEWAVEVSGSVGGFTKNIRAGILLEDKKISIVNWEEF